jgi:hypothetical protein
LDLGKDGKPVLGKSGFGKEEGRSPKFKNLNGEKEYQ